MIESIQEKLRLIREGAIIEESVDIDTLFTESITGDIGYITESANGLIIESDENDGKIDGSSKARLKKMIDWLVKKIKDFIQYIKEKTKEIIRTHGGAGKYDHLKDTDVKIFSAAIDGSVNLKAKLDLLKGAIHAATGENKSSPATIYSDILKSTKEKIQEDIIGTMKTVKFTPAIINKLPDILRDASNQRSEVTTLLVELSNVIGSLGSELMSTNVRSEVNTINKKLSFYSNISSVVMELDSIVAKFIMTILNLAKSSKEE
jgi:hypothetical protein